MTGEHPNKKAKTEHAKGPQEDGTNSRVAGLDTTKASDVIPVGLRSAADCTILPKTDITNVPQSSIRSEMGVSRIFGVSKTGRYFPDGSCLGRCSPKTTVTNIQQVRSSHCTRRRSKQGHATAAPVDVPFFLRTTALW